MSQRNASVLQSDGYYQYPGQAARQKASLTLGDASLTLHLSEGDSMHTLPQLKITPELGAIPLAICFPDGGRFMPADDALFRQWYFRYRRPGLVYQLERHKTGILVTFGGMVLAGVFFVMVMLPWLSGVVARQLPETVEQQLGRYSMTLLDAQLKDTGLSEARQAQLQTLFREVVPQEMRSKGGLHLKMAYFLEGPNALMLPDGTLILSDRLVKLAKSDDALAAVMLHEIGHYHYRHSLQMAVRSSLVTLTLMWIIGDISGIGDTLLQSAAFVNEMQFSRSMEREADEYAITHMQQQGRSLGGMIQIYSALEASYSDRESLSLPDWLSTHPAMQERIEHIQRFVGQ